MASSPEPKTKEVRVEVNLPIVLAKLQAELQRLSDLVSIGLTGAPKVSESEYSASPGFSSVHIASDQRMTWKHAREQFQIWCLKNSFTEAIDLTSAFLEECCMLARIFRLAGRSSGAHWNRALINDKKRFHRMGFPDKIRHLREHFGIASKFEDHVLSLNRARNCLVHRLGTVSAEDVVDGRLVVTWHSLKFVIVDNTTNRETILDAPMHIETESTLRARIGPHQREFAIGERIVLDHAEHSHTVLTFYVFALEIMQAVERLLPTEDVPPKQ